MPVSGPLWQGGAALDISDRALQYGDGLFETIAFRDGQGWFLDRHLARLAHGISQLGLQWPEPTELGNLIVEAHNAAKQHPAAVLKLMISAGGHRRGYRRQPKCPALVRAALYQHASSTSQSDPGLRLFLCDTKLALQPHLAGVKHLNRLEQVLASAEFDAQEYDEGLMCDAQGNLAEGTYSNLIMALDDKLVTPTLAKVGVHGVAREFLLERQQVVVGDWAVSELHNAQGLWLCNSLFGVRAVASVRCGAELISFQASAQTASLQQAFAQSWHSEAFAWNDARLLARLRARGVAVPMLSAMAQLEDARD